MQFNKLIPELSVSDLNKSLDFYTKIKNLKLVGGIKKIKKI